ncbi:MAG: nitroreductase [Herbinix sp.]|jgi:nitroreductase|nr:nitroreductase [Herbinix sp.]
MNTILENIVTRRSVRAFNEQTINKEDLDQIITAAVYAPSGMNRQSWHFTVIQNKEKMEKLAGIMEKRLGMEPNSYHFYNANVLIMVSNEKDNQNGLADSACAMENIFLMANGLGIGSVWINQLHGICDDEPIREILQELGVPDHHVVWGMAALGFTDRKPEPRERKEGTVHYVL